MIVLEICKTDGKRNLYILHFEGAEPVVDESPDHVVAVHVLFRVRVKSVNEKAGK